MFFYFLFLCFFLVSTLNVCFVSRKLQKKYNVEYVIFIQFFYLLLQDIYLASNDLVSQCVNKLVDYLGFEEHIHWRESASLLIYSLTACNILKLKLGAHSIQEPRQLNHDCYSAAPLARSWSEEQSWGIQRRPSCMTQAS